MSLYVNRGRTLARSQALQILFQAEALSRTVDEVLEGDALAGCVERVAALDAA